jgi:N-acetyl-beta-hexosaminidase
MGVPQIEDDPAGVSAGLVKLLLHEMAGLFPDSVLHIGGDETGSTPPCTLGDTKSWEVKIIDYVQNSLKKQVMG